MDKEKSEKLYSIISLFAIIDIPVAAVMIVCANLIVMPLWNYGVIITGMAIAALGLAVVGLIASKKGKAKIAEDEKTVFLLALLTLIFMGACTGIFGGLISRTANSVGPLDHIITHHVGEYDYPFAVASMPWAVVDLIASIAGIALSSLASIAGILNVVNIKVGSQTGGFVGTQTAARASSPPPSATAAVKSNFCAGCGAPLDASAKFCQKCGKAA